MIIEYSYYSQQQQEVEAEAEAVIVRLDNNSEHKLPPKTVKERSRLPALEAQFDHNLRALKRFYHSIDKKKAR